MHPGTVNGWKYFQQFYVLHRYFFHRMAFPFLLTSWIISMAPCRSLEDPHEPPARPARRTNGWVWVSWEWPLWWCWSLVPEESCGGSGGKVEERMEGGVSRTNTKIIERIGSWNIFFVVPLIVLATWIGWNMTGCWAILIVLWSFEVSLINYLKFVLIVWYGLVEILLISERMKCHWLIEMLLVDWFRFWCKLYCSWVQILLMISGSISGFLKYCSLFEVSCWSDVY